MVQFRYSAICLALGISALCSRSSTGFSVPTKSSSCITTRSNSSVVRQLKTKLHQSPVIENKEKIITSDDIKAKEPFINDGLFGWMQPYLDLFGFVEGKTVYYGPGVPVDELKFPSIIYSLDCTNITIYQSLKNHNKQPLFFAVGYTKSADTGL
mmetsp:Transcript_8223/g.10444  ORF Transcript_8223/g.10444 Transcript_8223/m.10444 type:complete len:154 (-) Transcript_8223:477-938(-)